MHSTLTTVSVTAAGVWDLFWVFSMIISHWAPLSSLSAGCQCHGQPVSSHPPYRCHPPPLQMSPSHLNIIRCSSLMISSGGNMAAPDAKKSTVAVSPGPPHSLSRNKSPAWSLTQQQSPNLSLQFETITHSYQWSVFTVHSPS